MTAQTEHVESGITREERIALLKKYFIRALGEDDYHGLDFDAVVLDVVNGLHGRYLDPVNEGKGGKCWCGGNIFTRNKCSWCDKCGHYFCPC